MEMDRFRTRHVADYGPYFAIENANESTHSATNLGSNIWPTALWVIRSQMASKNLMSARGAWLCETGRTSARPVLFRGIEGDTDQLNVMSAN